MASMADSQMTTVGVGDARMEKKPKFFREPGAMPRHERPVVPRSSAPTGVLSFPSRRKTALVRASA